VGIKNFPEKGSRNREGRPAEPVARSDRSLISEPHVPIPLISPALAPSEQHAHAPPRPDTIPPQRSPQHHSPKTLTARRLGGGCQRGRPSAPRRRRTAQRVALLRQRRQRTSCLPGDANCGMKLKRRRAVEVVRRLAPNLLPYTHSIAVRRSRCRSP
jgi:hypothetical protein